MSGKLFDWILNSADLMGEPLPGKTLVEISGDRRVLIEKHGGVTSYNTKHINVKTTFGIVTISGDGLELASMSKQQLVITGCISCVSLYRGRC